MKTRIAALALLLMTSVAPAALAQQPEPGAGWGQGHSHQQGAGLTNRPSPRGARGGQAGGQPGGGGPPAQARTLPAAPQAREGPGGFGGGRGWAGDRERHERGLEGPRGADAGGGPRGADAGGRRDFGRPGRGADRDGVAPAQGLAGPDRQDRQDRSESRDRRAGGSGPVTIYPDGRRVYELDRRTQEGQSPRDRRRYDGGGGPAIIYPDGRRVYEGDRRSQDGPWNDRDRDGYRDGRHDDRPQWRPGAYPRSFHSPRRYHAHPYRRPPHFYVHVWSFGELLPYAWFGPEYVITDWWAYDLPPPPPGYDWVRVGDDALLVDEYTGRIVQVVRDLFW